MASPIYGMPNPYAFTQEERDYIRPGRTCRTVTVGVDAEWQPVEFLSNGKHRGLSSHYINHISDYTCLQISVDDASHLSDYAQLLDPSNSSADFLSALVRTEEREQKYYFSQSYLTLPVVVAVSKGSSETEESGLTPISGVSPTTALNPVPCEADEPKKIAVVSGYAVTELIKHSGDIDPSCLHHVTSPKQALQAVADGVAQAYCDAEPIIEESGKDLPIRILATPSPYWLEVRMAVPKLEGTEHEADQRLLYSVISKALNALPYETRKAFEDQELPRPTIEKWGGYLVIAVFWAFLVAILTRLAFAATGILKRKKHPS